MCGNRSRSQRRILPEPRTIVLQVLRYAPEQGAAPYTQEYPVSFTDDKLIFRAQMI